MDCRPGCGACCIAPSITSPIPGMSGGKPAGMRCSQLDEQNFCKIFGQADRPLVCQSFTASSETCGNHREEALGILSKLEILTR